MWFATLPHPSHRKTNKRSRKSTNESNKIGVWIKKKELQGETYGTETANL